MEVVRTNMTQPVDLLQAIQKQMKRDGGTTAFSRWMGEAAKTRLDKDLLDGLGPRPKQGRKQN